MRSPGQPESKETHRIDPGEGVLFLTSEGQQERRTRGFAVGDLAPNPAEDVAVLQVSFLPTQTKVPLGACSATRPHG